MKSKTRTGAAALLLFASSSFNPASADVPQSFIDALSGIFVQIGQAFTFLFNEVSTLDARVSSLEAVSPNFGGYSMPFAADGALKNVVVLSQVQPNGDIYYSVRSRYATSTEQISIDGVPTQRPFIANYAFVGTDSVGNFLFANNYIEAPDTANYINFHVEESSYDAAANKTVTADTKRELWPCPSAAGGSTLTCMVTVTESATGDIVDHYTWSRASTIGGPITVNGMTFGDIRIEIMLDRNFSRIRAKGIGEILRTNLQNTSADREVVFYRVNGLTGGSLVGTPFAAGQPFAGVFF